MSIGRRVLPWAAGILLGSAATAIVVWSVLRPAPQAPLTPQRFPITIPSNTRYVGEAGGLPAISPDGTRLVYPAVENGKRLLYMRNLDQLEAQPIRGTDDAYNPFFSPDGEWIGFFTAGGTGAGKLKRIAVRGGPPLTLADSSIPAGVWNTDDTIVFVRSEGQSWSLNSIPSAGGGVKKLTTIAVDRQEVKHAWPEPLPGGRNILFTVTTSSSFDQAHIVMSPTPDNIAPSSSRAIGRYVPTGHIVYIWLGI
jgi:serine/threonine-protein kinase